VGRKQKELKEQKVDKQPKNNEGGITGKGWKKGQSGNPNGRPPKVKSIPDILRKIGEEEGTLDGKSKLDVIMYKVFQYALEGKPWAVQFIADRTEGKAKEIREVTNKNEPIKIITID
jgi:hypothetical protein